MMFVDDNIIRIITLSGLDCLIDIKSRNINLDGHGEYKLLSFTKIDNYKSTDVDVETHAIMNKAKL